MKRLNDSKLILLLPALNFVLMLAAANTYADFTFGEPVNLELVIPILDAMSDAVNCMSSDGLEMYIMRENVQAGYGGFDIWAMKRVSKDNDWGPLENLGHEINSDKDDGNASISADGLTLYIETNRSDGFGNYDIWVTTRETKESPWVQPINLGPNINTSVSDASPWISADDLELYFASWRPGGYGRGDIYVVKRETKEDPWGEPENLGPVVNSEYTEVFPCLSPDGLLLIFSSGTLDDPPRPGGYGGCDMWMTRRASLSDQWQTPVNLGPRVNNPEHEMGSRLSPDGFTLYFFTNSNSTWDNWQASILPACDFNDDDVVDIADVSIMIEHWQTDYPLCDIGPMPWGDGFVDAQDLMVLTRHLYESSRPKAHWKLDETEGKIAYDCVGKNHGTLKEVPVWRPDAGRLGGALEFHGIDDHVSIPFILDPAAGSFSVFAWVKCSERGKVIISQNDGTGTRWLWTDPSYGRLITWLMHPPFEPLISEKSITDGQWHHIGLIFDFQKFQRYLYVDGTRVARDTNLVGGCNSTGGLYLGADKTLVLNSFFCGLIDDVRIYDKVLSVEEIANLAQ